MMDDARNWAKRQLAPMTIGLMVAFVATSLLFWFTHGQLMTALWVNQNWLSHPWTLVTYPFGYTFLGGIGEILWFIMLLGWMNLTCTSVERTVGTPKYAILWLILSIVPALLCGIGMMILGQPVPVYGPYFPIAGLSYIWARSHKDFAMSFWFIPVNGLWISWIIVAGTLFGYGWHAPIIGALAVLYLIPCYFYAENKIPGLEYEIRGYQKYKPSKEKQKKDADYFDEVSKRAKEREERERLRKLFESSLGDDK